MGPVETPGERLVVDVLSEAIDEMTGRSNRKWAIIMLAALAGAFVALAIVRRRESRNGMAGDLAGDMADPLATAAT